MPGAMAELNAVGDVVLTDARAMRALAGASRLALHDALRRSGPATVDDLAGLMGLQPRDVSEDLAALEEVGLVERRTSAAGSEQATWAVIGRGVFFEIPDDDEGQSAARELSNAMLLQYVDLPRSWVRDHEPHLTRSWARAAGLLNVRLLLTAEELRDLQSTLEGVLEPFLTRPVAPPDASQVRILSYFMPEVSERERR
jgi:DNA-binding transcriptional ArsR family regulator